MTARGFRRRVPGRNPVKVFLVWTVVHHLVLVIFVLLYRVRRRGAEHVPREGPVIYVANHQSHLDPMIVGLVVGDRPFTPLARRTLLEHPLMRLVLRCFDTIPIDRGGSGDRKAMKALLAELEAGRAVLVFPEGTRTPDGTVQPFRPGVRLLLKRSDAMVVPVAIRGAYEVWPRDRSRPRLHGRIEAVAGEAIPAAQLRGEDALDELRRRVEAMRKGRNA